MSKVFLEADIDTADIVHALCSLTQEEILEFVKELDDTVGDWDFTRALRDHFVSEMRGVDVDELLASRGVSSEEVGRES